MKSKTAFMSPVGLVLILAAAVLCAVAFVPVVANAQEKQDTKKTETTAQKKETTKKTDAGYTYTAQPGDSYSKIARKAVQTYGLKYDVKMSGAQIIFAETNLTIEAGAPSVNVGQSVTISEAKVKDWVEKAAKLSDAKKAAWARYAVGVNFNTDSVGEKRS